MLNRPSEYLGGVLPGEVGERKKVGDGSLVELDLAAVLGGVDRHVNHASASVIDALGR